MTEKQKKEFSKCFTTLPKRDLESSLCQEQKPLKQSEKIFLEFCKFNNLDINGKLLFYLLDFVVFVDNKKIICLNNFAEQCICRRMCWNVTDEVIIKMYAEIELFVKAGLMEDIDDKTYVLRNDIISFEKIPNFNSMYIERCVYGRNIGRTKLIFKNDLSSL